MNIAASVDARIQELLLTKACRDSGGHRMGLDMRPLMAAIDQQAIADEKLERHIAACRRAGGCGEPLFSFGGEHWVRCGSTISNKQHLCLKCVA